MAALATGTQLGSYEIVAWLGAGGMGEAYCARDEPRAAGFRPAPGFRR